ncbi:hypothetical protein GW17_00047282 [Ensete ventricosum]|nr:hypothetical protein GW17_00047282 [Ensete ventricosum]
MIPSLPCVAYKKRETSRKSWRFGLSCSDMVLRDVLLPKPVLLPHQSHLFDGHALGFWHQEDDKQRHHQHEGREQVEEPGLEVAERHEEELSDDEGEEEVDADHDRLPRRPDVHREDLAGNQPPKRPP